MAVKLKKGDRVRHASKTEWGVGEVLAEPSTASVRIFFEDAGAKEFDLEQATLVKLEDSHDVGNDHLSRLVAYHLNELSKPAAGKKSVGRKSEPFISFKAAVQNFLTWFPHGFLDPTYLEGQRGERRFKERAHELSIELLAEDQLASLVEAGQFSDICFRAKRLVSATNLMSPYEMIWLSEGLKNPVRQQEFSIALFGLLYGEDTEEDRFSAFSRVLAEIGAAKWPIATYFQFLRFPGLQMFMKPAVTQAAAKVLHFELNYKPELNWRTYTCLLALAQNLRTKLEQDGRAALRPRDLIDVQSFIWVTAPQYH